MPSFLLLNTFMVFDPFKQQKLMDAYSRAKQASPAPIDCTIDQLKTLAGLSQTPKQSEDNITHTAEEKAKFMKVNNVRPGTDEWFRLWFAKPYLTGENPFGRK